MVTYDIIFLGSSLIQLLACCLFNTNPLAEPVTTHCHFDVYKHTLVKFEWNFKGYHAKNSILKIVCKYGNHFDKPSICLTTDATWQHLSGSRLAQVMACCLISSSHYLNQCWLFIKYFDFHLGPISMPVPQLLFCIMSLTIKLQNYCHILPQPMS